MRVVRVDERGADRRVRPGLDDRAVDVPRLSQPVRVDSQALALEVENGVLTIRLERPEARNALDREMIVDLRVALDHAATDDGVGAVILTGTGSAFCAGADLAWLDHEPDGRRYRFDSHRLTELVSLIERVEKPVIAAVNGIAVGVGVQLALACDLRVGGTSARFAFTEGQLGLLPTHGGVARLVKLVGLGRARDLLLGSRTVDAEQALVLGLLTEVAPDEDLLPAARRLVERALTRAPQSYGLVKRLLLVAASSDLTTAMTAESIGQSLLIGTDDHHEGRQAFRERRPPQFRGR
jgi:enoyl-CoA hydratase/carnithine racemase